MRESKVEGHLKKRARSRRALVRKVQWPGINGAPDRMVLLGTQDATLRLQQLFRSQGAQVSFDDCETIVLELVGRVIALVELKASDVKQPKVRQKREHEELRAMGLRVEVINTIEGVDRLLP